MTSSLELPAAAAQMLALPGPADGRLHLPVAQLYDLPELEIIFGARSAEVAMGAAELLLYRMADGKGVVVRTAPDTLALLVHKHGLSDTSTRKLGRLFTIEFQFEGEDIVLVPDVTLGSLAESTDAGAVYLNLYHDMQTARRREEQRQHYLRRERESHTRPAALSASTPLVAHGVACIPAPAST